MRWSIRLSFAVFALLVSVLLCAQVTQPTAAETTATGDNQSRFPLTREQKSNLSYVYIAGVEGVGHHAIAPAIATIAITCKLHVMYEMRKLRIHQQRRAGAALQEYIEQIAATRFSSTKVVILEDASFPSGGMARGTDFKDPMDAQYDIAWTHKQLLHSKTHVNVKYLYLNRDFYRAVASHPEFDNGFQRHAQVLHAYMWYIQSEYAKINSRQPDIWRQISYEWFTNMDTYNCTATVSAIVDFLQWDHCDVEFACKILQETVHKERKKEVHTEDYAYAQTFNVTLPIPVLDISPGRVYNFTTVVSKRTPFKVLSGYEARLKSIAEQEKLLLEHNKNRHKHSQLGDKAVLHASGRNQHMRQQY